MSTDHGPGTPSFGDLFDDPHAPMLPVDPAGRPSVVARPPVGDPEPGSPEAEDQVEPDGSEPDPTENIPVVGTTADDVPHLPPPEADAASDDTAGEAHAAEQEPEHDVAAGRSADSAEPGDRLAQAQPDDDRDDTPAWVEPHGDEHPDPRPDESADAAQPPSPDPAELGDEEPSTPVQADEPPAPVIAAAVAATAGAAGAAAVPGPWDGTVDPAISSAPANRVDTGRLYRSAGAEGPATVDAIPAIDPSYTSARPADADVLPATTPATRAGGSGLTYTGVFVVVGAVTILVGLADALITNKLGPITGVALAVSSIYAALVVRKADIWAAVVVPPLAFLAATLTAGQLTLDSSGSLVVREGYMIFRTLAVNAPWILGTTAVCLVIVLVRRRRA